MKKLFFFFLIFIFLIRLNGVAQFSRYVIQLKDKSGTPYTISNPSQFLTQRSIDRRTRYNIPVDSTDLPVTPGYVDSIRLSGNVTILNISKWFNQVCIQTTDAVALTKINSFSFVVTTTAVAANLPVSNPPINKKFIPINVPAPEKPNDITQDNVTGFYNYGQSFNQVDLHDGEFLHDHNFMGEGMIIAITDDGFYHYQTLPVFDSVRNTNRILGTWDFVVLDSNVNELDTHGMQCFSTIAANIPGSFMGTAPQSSFYLYRTEDLATEYPIELHNWIAAAERADSLGVDVISVSLGYNTFDNSTFDYTYNDLNGNTTVIARGVNAAARKGILVVAAAGNDGNDTWHYLDTPGDADSALTVGAVNTNGQVASFSSYGPNSAGQTKPDVAAVGLNATVADPNTGQPTYNSGTSFSTPIMAGLTTCLWQAFPEVSNMNVIDVLHKASNQANDPDDRTGYGIPNMKKAFVLLIKKLHSLQDSVADCKATISWTAKSDSGMNFIIERKISTDSDYQPVDTQFVNTGFQKNNFTYTDSLSLLPYGDSVYYRIKMKISADTSFYLDSAIFNYSGCVQPVAINFTRFSATKKNNTTLLNWSLANETAGSYFVIERSFDAVSFTNIATIKTNGNNIYSYIDTSLSSLNSPGIIYYRIEQFNANGSVAYTDIKSVSLKKGLIIDVYPNPAKNIISVKIYLPEALPISINIIDAAGKYLNKINAAGCEGININNFNLDGCASGTYLLRVNAGSENIIIPIIKN